MYWTAIVSNDTNGTLFSNVTGLIPYIFFGNNGISVHSFLDAIIQYGTAYVDSEVTKVDPGFKWPHLLVLYVLYGVTIAIAAVLNLGIVAYEQMVSDNRRTLINKVRITVIIFITVILLYGMAQI